MSFDDRTFATADGLKLHYRDYAAVGPASGPPVLCLHGLTRNVRDFEDLAPMIAGLGRRVIVASQRGRGESGRDPVVERYNPAVYAADMVGLLDHLEIPRAVFVGTSMGGLMTLITAAMAPGRIAAAVLNDIGPEIDPAGLERIRGYVGGGRAARSWEDAARMCRDINRVAFPLETGEAFWLGFARKLFRTEGDPGPIVLDYDPQIAASFPAAPRDDQPAADLWPLFDALAQAPVLVIRGEITDILMASTVAEMRRRKPDIATCVVPEVGHAPFMTEPAAWAALREFLTSRKLAGLPPAKPS